MKANDALSIQELHGNLQLIIVTVLPQFCASVIPDL